MRSADVVEEVLSHTLCADRVHVSVGHKLPAAIPASGVSERDDGLLRGGEAGYGETTTDIQVLPKAAKRSLLISGVGGTGVRPEPLRDAPVYRRLSGRQAR